MDDIEEADDACRVINFPRHISRLIVVEGFSLNFPTPKPNAWVRLWQRVFLGFRWEDIA